MNNKNLAIAIVGVLIISAVSGVLILTMMNTSGNDDRLGGEDVTDDNDNVPLDEGKANFVVTSLDISKHNVLAGIRATLTVGLKNNGTADGIYQLNIALDGDVVRSQNVSVEAGGSTNVTHAVSSPIVGNHTVAVGDSSTYLYCHDFFAVGTYMTYHSVEDDEFFGTLEYNYTFTYMDQDETTYTVEKVYEDNVHPSSTYIYDKSGSDQTYENLTFVGREDIPTTYGDKRLAHYAYTFDSGGYHFEVDTYFDEKTGVTFKNVTRTEGFTLTEELVDTDRAWIMEI